MEFGGGLGVEGAQSLGGGAFFAVRRRMMEGDFGALRIRFWTTGYVDERGRRDSGGHGPERFHRIGSGLCGCCYAMQRLRGSGVRQ